MPRFVMFTVCNYPGGTRVAGATWPCTKLFNKYCSGDDREQDDSYLCDILSLLSRQLF